jgi:chemotaxis protein MotA
MDVATVSGLILAWGALAASLLLEGGSPSDIFNLPALVLVVVGTIGATVIGSSIKTILAVPAIVRNALREEVLDQSVAIATLVRFARKARMQGILSLEQEANRISNRFLRKGVHLVVDGTPSVMVREILETEIVAMQERHKLGETFFTTLGGFSPTLGIIGTVMGLISMLAKLNQPGKMGHAIAAAFTATLYGVALANLAYLPIAAKLKTKTAEEVVTYEMIIEGILSIQAGDNPRIVEMRMMAYLPPSLRGSRTSEAGRDEREAMAA